MTEGVPDTLAETTATFAAKLTEHAVASAKLLRVQRKLLNNERPNPDNITEWLDAAAAVTSNCPELEKYRADLLQSWRQTRSVAFLQLDADLRELCKSRSWRLDGQWPDFVVEYGITVHLDESARSATIGELRTAANVAAIGTALERQIPSLLAKNFSPQKFLDSLFRAWQAATGPQGGQATILDVYRWFVIQSQSPKFWRDAKVSLFTPLSTDQFRARLSRTLGASIKPAAGQELRLLPPLDPKEALFVYQPSERRFGYIGRIQFLEAANRAS